jgi:hypothetical protein
LQQLLPLDTLSGRSEAQPYSEHPQGVQAAPHFKVSK